MKKIFIFLASLFVTVQIWAEEVPSLNISKASGDESKVALSEIVSIKFAGDVMLIQLKDGSLLSLPMSEILIMQFGVTSSIDALLDDEASEAQYTLTTLSGTVVATGKALRGTPLSLGAQPGLYVLTVGR